MKRLIVASAAVLALTACASAAEQGQRGTVGVDVTLPSGETVACVVYDDVDSGAGGVDCDWDGAR